jgi:thioredoxin reductase (NADPH)
MHITDITIIGAGPTGLFAIFEAGMLKMKCHVIDTLEAVGGQCIALYPEKPIYDIPAYPKIEAAELINQLSLQAAPFDPVYHLGQSVDKMERVEDGIVITTSTNTTIKSKAVIIAAGCGAFGPNRPPLANLEEYENKSVFYMVNNKEMFRGKRVVIAGGGDSAADWALSLGPIAEHIYFVHRRDKFRCAPDSVDKMKLLSTEGKLEFVTPYQLAELKGNNGYLNAVTVQDLDGNNKELKADYLLAFFGLAMELGPIAEWGLNLSHHRLEVESSTMSTNIPGVFAIGDIAHYPGKLKLILTGFAEGALAAHSAYKLVHPGEVLHFEYSTTKGIHSKA